MSLDNAVDKKAEAAIVLMSLLIMRHAIVGHAVNTTYKDVGSADIAYVHGWTVVGQCRSNCRG
ncbi:MAG: hypothetical protein ACNYZG_10995, partial [Gammaproteobacteria bacterium]